jgi:hypothetical protein
VGFVVDKVALGQVSPEYFGFLPVLHYSGKRKKTLIIFITGLHNEPQGCGASVASVEGPFKKKNSFNLWTLSIVSY